MLLLAWGRRAGTLGAGRPEWVGVRVRHGVGEGLWVQRCSLEGRALGLGPGRG